MGKIFKALQKSKKQRRPVMPRISPARGVGKPEQDFPKKAQPQKQSAPAEKPVKSAEQPAAVETRETDLGAIHGLLAGESITESPGTDNTSASDAKESPTKKSDEALSSIYEMIGDGQKAPNLSKTPADEQLVEGKIDNEPVIDLVEEVKPAAKATPPISSGIPESSKRADQRAALARKPAQASAPRQAEKKSHAEKVIPTKETIATKQPAKKKVKVVADAVKKKTRDVPAVLKNISYEKIDRSLVTLLKPRSFEAEQFKLLRTNLMFPVSGQPPKSILITSALPGDGKSFVASNLAISFALNLDRRVLLIDCDIRKPDIHERFGFKSGPGLSDFLTKGTPLPPLLVKTNLPNLTILPGGRPPHNPSELLSSEKMPALLKEVTTRYADRYVIIDAPPPKLTAETGVLARLVDGIVVVVNTGSTKREMVEELVELLGRDKILGVIMNQIVIKASRYYGYGKYGRYDRYYSK